MSHFRYPDILANLSVLVTRKGQFLIAGKTIVKGRQLYVQLLISGRVKIVTKSQKVLCENCNFIRPKL